MKKLSIVAFENLKIVRIQAAIVKYHMRSITHTSLSPTDQEVKITYFWVPTLQMQGPDGVIPREPVFDAGYKNAE